MTVITFTEDTTLPDEPPGSGPHYKRGYVCEVNERVAQQWIAKGVAKRGRHDLKYKVSAETQPKTDDDQGAGKRFGRKAARRNDESKP